MVTSWWVNPMNQPTLSRRPMASLAESFGRAPARLLQGRAREVWGPVEPLIVQWMATLLSDRLDGIPSDHNASMRSALADSMELQPPSCQGGSVASTSWDRSA